MTLGATYYLNPNHKLMLNIGWVDNNANAKPNKDYSPIPPGTSTAQIPIYGDKFNIIAFRYALAF